MTTASVNNLAGPNTSLCCTISAALHWGSEHLKTAGTVLWDSLKKVAANAPAYFASLRTHLSQGLRLMKGFLIHTIQQMKLYTVNHSKDLKMLGTGAIGGLALAVLAMLIYFKSSSGESLPNENIPSTPFLNTRDLPFEPSPTPQN